jgi:lysyl-tRNA synthetase class 2
MLSLEGLHVRGALFRSIRSFFHSQNFLEVDTPVRQPVLIPESNIQPIQAGNCFLQSSPEQCMKRLLARGCRKIFQICPCFRGNERGRHHLEEFTMLEWYRVAGDYHDLMVDCEKLLQHVFTELSGDSQTGRGVSGSCLGTMTLDEPWERVSVGESFRKYSPVALNTALSEDRFDELLVEYIEPHLGFSRPTFLYDYPAECASLSRLKPGSDDVAERFELYIEGVELANGFSELTDPEEQRNRFLMERDLLGPQFGDMKLPERFLEELAGIEKAAGIAFGIDRLLMLLLSERSIDQVVSFSPVDW